MPELIQTITLDTFAETIRAYVGCNVERGDLNITASGDIIHQLVCSKHGRSISLSITGKVLTEASTSIVDGTCRGLLASFERVSNAA